MGAYEQGVAIHEIFSYLFFLPYFWNLFVLFRHKTYLSMNKKIYFIMPITIFLLGVAIITGIFLLPMRGFELDSKIILMMIVLCIFLAGEIRRMKTLKKAKTSKEGMQKYVKSCKIMYAIFIILWLCLIVYCNGF